MGQEDKSKEELIEEISLLNKRIAELEISDSKRKQVEKILWENEEKYRTFFVESKDAMMTVSPDEGFLSGNPAAIRMFGCRDEKDFTSRAPAELSPKNQQDGALSSDKAREMMLLALEKGANFFEWTYKRIDGTEFPATVLLSRVEKGGKVYLQSIVCDITESKKAANEALKESQEQLFQASKMASMGQLSAGAAHEINNPLTAIVGFTQAMLKDLENQKFSSDKITHDLKIVLKNTERCKVIISNLLNFVRAKELQRQKSDINILIDDALSFVEYKTIIQNIQVVKKYEKNLPKVNIDQDQIVQVFINVISNAQNAMPDGGELLVSTWSENNFAVIEFKDTGIGIEKENLLRVFDPFFTTRQPGQGVGLGLSVSYSIMKRHGGSIEAKSDGKNKGASFIIKIPV